jgi:predicted HTH transcriptional regulator
MLIANKKGRWTDYRLNEGYECQPEQIGFAETSMSPLSFRNETDRIIYEYAKANRFITTAQVIQITRITTRQGASLALNRLINRGLLHPSGKGKSTIYECVE